MEALRGLGGEVNKKEGCRARFTSFEGTLGANDPGISAAEEIRLQREKNMKPSLLVLETGEESENYES